MEFRIVYHSAILHKGKWFAKVAYVLDGKPAIEEGQNGYDTRQQALDAAGEMDEPLKAALEELSAVER